MSIVEFLLARIVEEQRHAEALWATMQDEDSFTAPARLVNLGALVDPRRVIAECQAKRALIEQALEVGSQVDGAMGCVHDADELRQGHPLRGMYPTGCLGIDTVHDLLAPLAAVYADRPDYDPDWRP